MFRIKFSEPETFNATFQEAEPFDVAFHETIEVPVGDAYRGSYEFTPTDNEQEIQIAEKVATRNIVIHAIPHENYGHLQWDGSTLTIY